MAYSYLIDNKKEDKTVKYNDENLLEMVELYAEEVGNIESEEDLSSLFDSEIAPLIVAQYGEDDKPAMSEGFNNWADSLCTDGVIHPEQYNKYRYVGTYS